MSAVRRRLSGGRFLRVARAWAVATLVVGVVYPCVPLAVPGDQPPPLSGPRHRGEVRALAKGRILVASRALTDPNFVETVVLIVEFSDQGVVGLIVNRQSDIPLGRVFTGPEGLHALGGMLFRGGPVEVKGILGLARSSNRPQDRHVIRDIYLVNSRESLETLAAAGARPDRFRVYAGYSGWGAEQLQRETMAGAWSVLDGDSRIVFDHNPDTLWDRLITRTGGLQANAGSGPRSWNRQARPNQHQD